MCGRTEVVDYVKESKLMLDYIAKIDRGEPVMGPNPTAPSPAGDLPGKAHLSSAAIARQLSLIKFSPLFPT